MVRIKLKYIVEDADRHGTIRLYVRMPGRPKMRLRGVPGSSEFMAAYQAAITRQPDKPRQAREAARGSFRRLCTSYFASSSFAQLDPMTQNWERRALERICESSGDKPVAMMQPKHVRKLRDDLREMPGASKTRLKALRALFR